MHLYLQDEEADFDGVDGKDDDGDFLGGGNKEDDDDDDLLGSGASFDGNDDY